MEKFPTPEAENHNKLDKLKKAALVGTALISTMVAEGQNIKHEVIPDNHITIPVPESSESHMENQKIFANLEKIEEYAKKLSPKVSKDHSLTYAVITESTALGRAGYLPNKLESALAQDALIEIANIENRNYRVMDRDFGSIRALLKERELMHNVGNEKDAALVFEYYTPVDIYITVGANKENDSTLSATIRVLNLQTKQTDMYKITHTLKREAVPEDGYFALEKAVEEKVKEIVTQYGEN